MRKNRDTFPALSVPVSWELGVAERGRGLTGLPRREAPWVKEQEEAAAAARRNSSQMEPT